MLVILDFIIVFVLKSLLFSRDCSVSFFFFFRYIIALFMLLYHFYFRG